MKIFNRYYSFLILYVLAVFIVCGNPPDELSNSIGMKFKRINSGTFIMGESNSIPESLNGYAAYRPAGDWDEQPVHKVKISHSFYISETEVTIEQFRQFQPDYKGSDEFKPYATGISWYDAVAFCQWLTEKERKPYRLPTEAEWEYVCRAGSQTLFSSGDSLPVPDTANAWDIKNMHTNAREWCWDWHGNYRHEDQTDPVGPDRGVAKVVRGGGLDRQEDYFTRSANRAGIAPNFPPISLQRMNEKIFLESHDNSQQSNPDVPEGFRTVHRYQNFIRDVLNNQGNHPIGFRVVQAPMPKTEPYVSETPFVQQCIKQNLNNAQLGPDPKQPCFRKRYLLPTPPENISEDKLHLNAALGFHPAILKHHHSPALEVCANGDVLAIYYTSVSETSPDVALIASRLRFGSDQWDMPDLLLDFPDVNDHAPLLWNEQNTLRFFWGNNKLESGFPFQLIKSSDNGATWSEVHFPLFKTTVGGHSAQPINTAFRGADSTIYVASDGVGPESILWVSHDNGKTWIDTKGRSGGRHTTFVLLNDGQILGMGGKSSDIDGYMPKSISTDGGKTWQISKTPFCSLGSNQRPTIIRLASGRLFFAGDFQHRSGAQPQSINRRGCYVALSEDEGETWHIKPLPGAQEHEDPERRKDLRGATLGYAVARQAPNGVIHLITSMNEPCLHFAMNESWILQPESKNINETDLMETVPTQIQNVTEYREEYSSGKIKAIWSAGFADNGQCLLHGTETWYYEDGRKQWEVSYQFGKKVGTEIYWSKDGNKLWSWDHQEDGSSVWTHYWNNGKKKSESIWRNLTCQGISTRWDTSGEIMGQVRFQDGNSID